ncbi:Ribosomal-protein-L7p-serine acetyltransferase [Croceitalea dokdonensis DOKDO 023]|uniref:Ribosomal-protein-L7p-serine acetyltransferase n=1 Tax=Croceitalea dokdonensis DOKDO 023 TaxID=1300341 RepID=A0A0P7AGG0_9FLAO|nr:GNAT family protein [Croceitalea dokdonensis]KPM31082.1 Ribosomal-protein-L7p-serine acetyltransferase [Croceitalea dokdonensis DOKDO 023]
MQIAFDNYSIAPIHHKDAWRLCDFMVANERRFQQDFPETLKQNLNPTLSRIFVNDQVNSFQNKTEFLFTVKENTNRAIIGLVYVKELHKVKGQGELAYCIGYDHEGKGITSKVVSEITAWSFNDLGLHALQIIAHETNTASIRIAEKNGFVYQKELPKSHRRFNGELVNMQLYQRYKSNITV